MTEIALKLNIPHTQFKKENWSTLPGCYILYRENDPIPRIGGIDEKGILYIGKGQNISRRVNSLRDSVICNSSYDQKECIIKGHNSLSQKFYRSRKNILLEHLRIRIFQLKKDVESSYLEAYLLETYVSLFGELPPFNGSYCKHSLGDTMDYLKKNEIELPRL